MHRALLANASARGRARGHAPSEPMTEPSMPSASPSTLNAIAGIRCRSGGGGARCSCRQERLRYTLYLIQYTTRAPDRYRCTGRRYESRDKRGGGAEPVSRVVIGRWNGLEAMRVCNQALGSPQHDIHQMYVCMYVCMPSGLEVRSMIHADVSSPVQPSPAQ